MLFFFKLQQADWQLLFGKVFSPLPWSAVAYDTINTRVRRQRKLRKDYEDEVSDRIALQDLFSLSPWVFSAANKDGEPSQFFLQKGGRGGGETTWRKRRQHSLHLGTFHSTDARKKILPADACLCQGGMEILLKKACLSLISIISMHGEKKFTVKWNSSMLL